MGNCDVEMGLAGGGTERAKGKVESGFEAGKGAGVPRLDGEPECGEHDSPRRGEVLILARSEGMSYEEIAQTLGISKQTVANHVSMALSDLRRHLLPEVSNLGIDAPSAGQ